MRRSRYILFLAVCALIETRVVMRLTGLPVRGALWYVDLGEIMLGATVIGALLITLLDID